MSHTNVFGLQPMRAVRLALAVGLLGACSDVEMKKETPHAAITSIIKAFDAGREDLAASAFDPVLARMDARELACVAENLKRLQCNQEMNRVLAAHMANHLSSERISAECSSFRLSDCTCGPKGGKAASASRGIRDTRVFKWLKATTIAADDCAISSSDELTFQEQPLREGDAEPAMASAALNAALPLLSYYACEDVSKRETAYATVTLKCGGHATPIQAVMRRLPGGWHLFDLSDATKASFLGHALAVAAEESQR